MQSKFIATVFLLTVFGSASTFAETWQEQGNAAHTGFANVKTDPSKFRIRWTKALYTIDDPLHKSSSELSISTIAADKRVYLDVNHHYYADSRKPIHDAGERVLMGIDTQTGETVWEVKGDNVFRYTSIAYHNQKIFSYFTRDQQPGLYVIDAATGIINYHLDMAEKEYITNGLLVEDGSVYPVLDNKVFSIDSHKLALSWVKPIDYYQLELPAANEALMILAEYDGIKVYQRKSGDLLFKITSPELDKVGEQFNFNAPPPVFDETRQVSYGLYRNKQYQRSLVAFDLNKKAIKWISPGHAGYPAIADNEVYVVSNGNLIEGNLSELHVLDSETGKVSWVWKTGTNTGLIKLYGMVVTPDLVFVSGMNATYVISRKTHQKVWEIPVSGNMTVSDNTLFITSEEWIKIPNTEYSRPHKVIMTAITLN